jgi:sugar O-acyltransferase (sialic acid O-acetyltransferase NeuD family)
MIIIGAKGHAKELVELLQYKTEKLFFFDNVSDDLPDLFLRQFKILRTFDEVKTVFTEDKTFALGIGNPIDRYNLAKLFIELEGRLTSVISENAFLSHYNISLGEGLNIMPGVFIYNDTSIGEGTLINTACSIHHDVSIGNYCEISPGARILGRARVGEFCSIGSNAVVLQNIKIGGHATVGAGAVVTKNIPSGETWAGVPAKKIN